MTGVRKPSHTLTSNGTEYDVYALIELSAHITPKPLSIRALSPEMMQEKCWTNIDGSSVSPTELIDLYTEHKDWEYLFERFPIWRRHIEKVRNADYSFPLLYYKGEIIDGMHRLVKAISEGQQTVIVRELDSLPEAAIIKAK